MATANVAIRPVAVHSYQPSPPLSGPLAVTCYYDLHHSSLLEGCFGTGPHFGGVFIMMTTCRSPRTRRPAWLAFGLVALAAFSVSAQSEASFSVQSVRKALNVRLSS